MRLTPQDKQAVSTIARLSQQTKIDINSAKITRTSSRLCLGVEHGDYNGTELFGIGTDRFIWLAYKPNTTGRMRFFSGNFPDDGVVQFNIGQSPEPKSESIAHTWARFPFGVEFILRRAGIKLKHGIDAIVYGDIPGGGMSRSASLTLNLILSLLDANNIKLDNPFKIAELAQAVENDYIGSPCGQLDQIMILFAKAGTGTHYNPGKKTIDHIPLGQNAVDFRFVILDTGTVRPGLEKSTYKIRVKECKKLIAIIRKAGYDISSLADIKDKALYEKIMNEFRGDYRDLCDRLKYIFYAQQRFYEMLNAWKAGDIEMVGRIFRADGIGLRDDYKISGPEMETMCEIARSVPGVLGERMLGGGDKGAVGALVTADSVDTLTDAVNTSYPRKYPQYSERCAVHTCKSVDGVTVYEDLLK